MFATDNPFEARRGLVAFYHHRDCVDVDQLATLRRTIARWETAILRWHRTGLTNAATEGRNLIIKNLMRTGFGFRDFDNYRPRLLLRSGAPHGTLTRSHQYDPATHAPSRRAL